MSDWVAVTGATGFIGQSICRTLHQHGWKIRALLRTPSRAQPLAGVVDEWVSGHLLDADSLRNLLSGVGAVVHCAGNVRGASRHQFDRVNVDGMQKLVHLVSECPYPPRLLVLSSLAAREPQLSYYASSKRKGEEILQQQAGNLQWIALRPPAVYGPGDQELLPLFRIMAKGVVPLLSRRDARFSMLYVDDLAGAVMAWLRTSSVPNGVYALHDGQSRGYCWSDVSAIVSSLCRRRVYQVPVPAALLAVPAYINRWLARWFTYSPMLTPEKLRELRHSDWVCDNRAISGVLDWRPEVRLEKGLRNMPGWCPRLG